MIKSRNEHNQLRFSPTGEGLIQPVEVELNSHRIHGRNRLEKFLHGTKECKAIVYVIGLDFKSNILKKSESNE